MAILYKKAQETNGTPNSLTEQMLGLFNDAL